MKMRKNYSVEILADAKTCYETMLGLRNKLDYEAWTAVFNPTSTFKGNWQQGSRMYFIGTDESGIEQGMVADIKEINPNKFVSIMHIGTYFNGKEQLEGEEVEKWAGSFENYSFIEQDGKTTVQVDIDVLEDYLDYFEENYPKSLQRLKERIETGV